jgi:P27 family predicted phage terminase small subunit
MRGRKPKPTEQKKVLGNPGKRPLGTEPQFDLVESTAPPAHLDADARLVWLEHASMLSTRKLLTVADLAKFEQLCKAVARARQFDAAIQAVGGVGSPDSARLVVGEVKYMLLIDKFGSAFGMDPSARARLKTPEPQKSHWLDALTGDSDDSVTVQ